MSMEKELKRKYPSITKEHLQDASKRMNILVNWLKQVLSNPSESSAIGIGYSIKESAKEIAKDDDLDSDLVCAMIFDKLE
jgi:hypothetical protein